MILQPFFHFQIILVYLKLFAVCKISKELISSLRNNQGTWHPFLRGGWPWIRDRSGIDKVDASLFEVSIEDICFTIFYYEPTSVSELFKLIVS